MFVFRKFRVLCFLEAPVLRFAFLCYYRRILGTLLFNIFITEILYFIQEAYIRNFPGNTFNYLKRAPRPK